MSLRDNYLRKGEEYRQWRSISTRLSNKRRCPVWERSLRERVRWHIGERSLAAPIDEWSPGTTSRPANIDYISHCFIHCPIIPTRQIPIEWIPSPKRPCLCSLLRHQSSDCVITVRSHVLSLPLYLLRFTGKVVFIVDTGKSEVVETADIWNVIPFDCIALSMSIDSCCSVSSHPSFAPCFPWRKTPCWILFLPLSLLRCPLSPILPVSSLHYAIAWSSSPMLHW